MTRCGTHPSASSDASEPGADCSERALREAPWSPLLGLRRARRGMIVSVLLGCLLVGVFGAFPGLDLATSARFFDATAAPPVFRFDRVAWMEPFVLATAVAARLVLLASLALLARELWRPTRRRLQVIVVALSLALGPGLVVNEVLKPAWSRARPRDLQVFGGTLAFTPVTRRADQCPRNCSFPSGHGGAAFAPLVGHFVSRRRCWLVAGLVLGGVVCATRLISGAHFLSDLLASGIVVYATGAIVAWAVLRRR
ncbi:MAG: phosphatase PAP2 family protein [Lautropia sp.]